MHFASLKLLFGCSHLKGGGIFRQTLTEYPKPCSKLVLLVFINLLQQHGRHFMAEGWAEFPDILSKHPNVEIRHMQAAPLGTQNAEQLRMSLIDYNVK